MKKCPNCNFENQDNSQFCQNCGAPLPMTVPQGQPQQPKNASGGMCTASMVLGIVGLVLTFVVIGIVPAIIGLVLGIIALVGKKPKRGQAIAGVVLSGIAIILFALLMLGTSLPENQTEDEDVATEQVEEQGDTDDLSQNDNSSQASPLSDEIKQFQSGGYVYITNSDLSTYAVNMSGVKVYIVTQVDDMKDGMIQSTLDDGFMMSNFNVGDNYDKYSEFITEDDTVAIAGTVADMTDYSFVGKSVELNDCIVFAIGDDANKYDKDSTDESLSQYLTVTEDVADTEDDISEEDYKNLCQQLNYEDILRNPDTYDGEYCVVSGTVDQIIEGWFDTYTIYVMDASGNKWECGYMYKDGESHLLEGDSVTVYGKCNGTTTATTLMGEQVTSPYVDAEYIN